MRRRVLYTGTIGTAVILLVVGIWYVSRRLHEPIAIGHAIVASDGEVLRARPMGDGAILRLLDEGEPVEILELIGVHSTGNGMWVKVQLRSGQQGYLESAAMRDISSGDEETLYRLLRSQLRETTNASIALLEQEVKWVRKFLSDFPNGRYSNELKLFLADRLRALALSELSRGGGNNQASEYATSALAIYESLSTTKVPEARVAALRAQELRKVLAEAQTSQEHSPLLPKRSKSSVPESKVDVKKSKPEEPQISELDAAIKRKVEEKRGMLSEAQRELLRSELKKMEELEALREAEAEKARLAQERDRLASEATKLEEQRALIQQQQEKLQKEREDFENQQEAREHLEEPLELQMIVISPTSKTALINKVVYREGQAIAGGVVKEIRPDSVLIQTPSGTRELKLKQSPLRTRAQYSEEKQDEKQEGHGDKEKPYDGPSSGIIVWQGEVKGTEMITIEDGASSSGTVTGTLPGVPCLVEPLGTKKVAVASAPSPSNQWKRVVIRVEGKGRIVVRLQWSLR